MEFRCILSWSIVGGLGWRRAGKVLFRQSFCSVASISELKNPVTFSKHVTNVPPRKNNNELTWKCDKTVVNCRYKDGNGKLPVKVNVFDNHLGHNAPTVVMLLGLSGSGEDFRPMVDVFTSAGIRCIAPELPGFGDSVISRSDIYRLDFTSVGQSQMLIDILREIDIERVDSLVAHSAASWLAVRYGSTCQNVKSLSLINPMSIRPNKAMRPYLWTKLVGATARNTSLWPIVDSYIEIGARRSGFKIPSHERRQMFVSLETVSTVDFDLITDDVKALRENRLPVFMAWSRNDKMIEEKLSRDLLNTLGMPTENDVSGDHPGQNQLRKELVFESGGHALHKKQAYSVSEHIISMLSSLL
ncbi:uncharacterized protein LOC111123718 [Crassostrea virginica]